MYIFSTNTNDIEIIQYAIPENPRQEAIPLRRFTIKGGANLTNKNFITPRGVATRCTSEELEWLLKQRAFQQGVGEGFFSCSNSEHDLERTVSDMQAADKSAPLTPKDYEPGGRRADSKTGAPKVTGQTVAA